MDIFHKKSHTHTIHMNRIALNSTLRRALLLMALFAGTFATADAQDIHEDGYALLPGGCHFYVDIDEETGERHVYQGAEAQAASTRRKAHAASTSDGLGQYGKSSLGPIGSMGDVEIPVVLADFSDQKFLSTDDATTIAKVDRWFNEEGYSDEGMTGSVRDYFIAQSGGMFRPHFKIMGLQHTGNSVATYGAGGSNQENVEGLAHKVCPPYNYSQWGSTVPLCIIMYAGNGQHQSGQDSQIWAKFVEYSGLGDAASLFGQHFRSYLYINESNGYEMNGIGTACHEISHAMGLPDIYDTKGGGCVTPGLWDLMASGNYVNGGHTPMAYSALERSQCGWLQIRELSGTGACTLKPQEAALVRSSGYNGEYYIFENRTNNRWTPSDMGGGLLVFHVEYGSSQWENSKVNTVAGHPRMMFVFANNASSASYSSEYKAALYPSPAKNDRLDPSSTPAMTAYNGDFNGKGIYNIRRCGTDITFDYGAAISDVRPIYNSVDEYTAPSAVHNMLRKVGTTPVASISQIDESKSYALYNPHFTTYATYNPGTSNGRKYLWAMGMTGDETHAVSYNAMSTPYSPASNYNTWRVKKLSDGRVMLQNEGSGLYLSTNFTSANVPCPWDANASSLYVKELSSGLFAFSTSGNDGDWACVAPQNGDRPIVNWLSSDDGAGWQLFPIEVGEDKYTAGETAFPINFDKTASGTSTEGRSLSYVALRTTDGNVQRADAASPIRTYQNLSATTFTVKKNSVIYPSIGYNGAWMHGYFYIDYNQDGQLSMPTTHSNRDTDLCSFNFWSEGMTGNRGYNSSGNYISNQTNYVVDNVMSLPAAIAPAVPGTYHMRYKVDWDNIQPGGSTQIVENSGFIVDVTLVVEDDGVAEHPDADLDPVFPISVAKKAQGTHSDGNRVATYVALTPEGGEEQRIDAFGSRQIYQNLTNLAAFTVKAGSKFTPAIGYNGSWMHGYLYIDANQDGTLVADASTGSKTNEMLSYTFYNSTSETNGYNSLGVLLSGDNRNSVQNGAITLPVCTAPSTPGTYYMRYKVDWNNIEPGGSTVQNNLIAANNGYILDVKLVVTEDDTVDPIDPVDPLDPVDPIDPVDPDGGDYFTPDPNSETVFPISVATNAEGQNTGRTLSYVALTVEGGEEQKVGFSPAVRRIYNDCRNEAFVVNPGDRFLPTIGFNGSWMHGYLYIDLDRNGELSYNPNAVSQSGTDCVAFSFWSGSASDTAGYDSDNNRITGDKRNVVINDKLIQLPVVTAPSTPGVYYMRYKVDWNDVNPAGSTVTNNTILKNSGFIVDLALRVKDPLDINGDGRVTIADVAEAVTLLLVNDDNSGVTFQTVEAIRDRILQK